MPKRTKEYHSWLVQKLADPVRAKRYLKQANEDSSEMFLKALRNVAEARGMARIAEETGLNRENLYRTLSDEGNPTLSTLRAVLDAVGLRLDIGEKLTDTNTLPVPTPTPSYAQANAAQISETGGRKYRIVGSTGFTGNVAATTNTVSVVSVGGTLYRDIPYLSVLVAAAQMDENQEAAQG